MAVDVLAGRLDHLTFSLLSFALSTSASSSFDVRLRLKSPMSFLSLVDKVTMHLPWSWGSRREGALTVRTSACRFERWFYPVAGWTLESVDVLFF